MRNELSLEKLIQNPLVLKQLETAEGRRAFVSVTGFKGFLAVYLRDKFKLGLAGLHKEIINTIETRTGFIGILGFRGCGKSTLSEYYSLYSMVEKKSLYTVYLSKTDEKARQAVMNIKKEIENNKLLQEDYDIRVNVSDKLALANKWTESLIVVNDCAIQARSKGSQVRGLKFLDSRITMVVCDDLEDTEDTKSDENRKKTRHWFYSELVEAMAQGELGKDSKVVMIGNLVHRDCLLAHLDNKSLDNSNENIVKVSKYPLINDEGEVAWKGMYPTLESIEEKKKKVMLSGEGMGSVIWAREYLLKMIDEQDQVIKEEDIHYYPDEWLLKAKLRGGVGVDLAISQKQTADYTVFVKAFEVYNDDGERRILIAKNNIKDRLDFERTIKTAKLIQQEMPEGSTFFVEDVGYQASAIEVMQKNGINAQSVKVSKDKRSRLVAISPYIKSGMVLFPKSGADDILKEMIGFGIEAHDDAMDACVHVIDGLLKEPEIFIV